MAAVDVTRLDRINWDFPKTGTARGSIQSLHWFPGNFIAQIPSALVQVLSIPGQVVCDPFSGSGTTGIEATRLNRRAIMSDRLSACILIAQAKLSLLTHGVDASEIRQIQSALTFDQQCRSDQFGANNEGSHDQLRAWYSEATLGQLRFLWRLIETMPSNTRRILTAVFSDVLFQCASTGGAPTRTGKKRRHHWGWVADNVIPKHPLDHNAIALFRSRIGSLPVSGFPFGDQPTLAFLLQQDARKLALANDSVDLIVTSPPYIGMIDYAHANRLLYAWMGWSLKAERHDEIGARFRRSRTNIVSEYLHDMNLARDEMYRVLRSGAYCAIVLGQSKRFPGTAKAVFAEFAQSMRLAWGPVPRNPTRRRVSERAAREPVEFIAVFQKS